MSGASQVSTKKVGTKIVSGFLGVGCLWRDILGFKISLCQDRREWAGATCQHAVKRIVRLSHRSGVAMGALPATLSTMTAVMIVDFSENAVTVRCRLSASTTQLCSAWP
jgi:hypothetical protein